MMVAVLVAVVRTAGAQTAPCDRGITPEEARLIFDALKKLGAETDCRLLGFRTERSRGVASFASGDAGNTELVLSPRACAPAGAPTIGAFGIERAEAFRAACPAAYAGLSGALGEADTDTARLAVPWQAAGVQRVGNVVFGVCVTAVLACLVWLLARWRTWHLPRAWWAILVIGLGGALAMRLSVSPDLSNWYAEVAAPVGGGWPRFGPVSFSLQAVCAAVFPWSDRALFAVNAVLGALTVPLFALALRACGVDALSAAGTTALFALAPLHVRVSASPSEHVLAAALTMLALVLWTWAARDHRWWLGAAALLVAPAAAFARADALPQLMMIPLWGLVARAQSNAPHRRLARKDGIAVGVYCVVLAGIGLAAWRLVIVPARHPMPELQGIKYAAVELLGQFWRAAVTPPHWVSLTALVLGALGLGVLAIRRRALMATVLASLALCFVPLGRTLDADGLVGSRYFQLAIPIALVLSGAGFGWLCSLVARTLGAHDRTARWATGALFAALVTLALVEGREPLTYRYTFQDEYRFLREAMASLPQGCTITQLPLRGEALLRDLDCCLDAPRSPLILARPDLRFEYADPRGANPSLARSDCVAYYEGAACSLADTLPSRQRAPNARAWFNEGCGLMRSAGALELTREAQVSPHATVDHFADRPVVVRLYRMRPSTR